MTENGSRDSSFETEESGWYLCWNREIQCDVTINHWNHEKNWISIAAYLPYVKIAHENKLRICFLIGNRCPRCYEKWTFSEHINIRNCQNPFPSCHTNLGANFPICEPMNLSSSVFNLPLLDGRFWDMRADV
jgi:hypothetical protein